MTAVPPFQTQFEAAWPAHTWCDAHVVLAVSAGPDSVAMLRTAATRKREIGGAGSLFVAHLNHALRGADAESDQIWLKNLCERLNLPLELGRVDVRDIAAQHGGGLEAAARTARYDFLRSTAERLGARFVATAHTADDQVETVLHRILRGTGLAGLTGIPSMRPLSPSVTLVRPLLRVRRRDVLAYLDNIGQDYRTDTSNADPRFTRNRLRHDLLPHLRKQYNAEVDAALLRLAVQAHESQKLISKLAADLAQQCVDVRHEVLIDCRPLSNQPALIVREVCRIAWSEARWPLQAMGFDEWQQLAEMARGDSESQDANLPANVRARRQQHLLILQRLDLA